MLPLKLLNQVNSLLTLSSKYILLAGLTSLLASKLAGGERAAEISKQVSMGALLTTALSYAENLIASQLASLTYTSTLVDPWLYVTYTLKLLITLWVGLNITALSLTIPGSVGLIAKELVEPNHERAPLIKRAYRPSKRVNPHELATGSSGSGKSNYLKLRAAQLSKTLANIIVLDFTGEYSHLASKGFKVIDTSKQCLDIHSCQPHLVAEALRIAYPQAGELSAAIVENRLAKTRDLKELADTLIAESEHVKAGTTRSALRSIGEKLKVLSQEVTGVGLQPSTLLKGKHVVSLASLIHDESKAFIAELLLRVMFSHAPRGNLNLTIVVNEVHRLILREPTGVEPIIVRLLRELRKYGVKVLAATQRFTDLPDPVTSNFATHLAIGPPAHEDLAAIKKTRGELLAQCLESLGRGEAIDLTTTITRKLTRKVKVIKIYRYSEEPPIAKLIRRLRRAKPVTREAEATPSRHPSKRNP